jgi:hypothetical protein
MITKFDNSSEAHSWFVYAAGKSRGINPDTNLGDEGASQTGPVDGDANCTALVRHGSITGSVNIGGVPACDLNAVRAVALRAAGG